MKLTKRIVDSTHPPKAGQIFIRDTGLPGFALRVTSKGAKSFIFEGRIHGRVRRITIGPYGPLTVETARNEALSMKSDVSKGKDPARERKDRITEPSFKYLTESYIERHAKPHKKSWKEDENLINRLFSPWSNRKLSSISRDEVARLHQKIGHENGNYMANRAASLLRKMFNLGMDWGLLPEGTNPATRVKFFREEKRERFLSPDELRAVLMALKSESNPYWRAYFTLDLLLGARKNELLSMRWEDIDFTTATWKIPTTKAGRPHTLPIPTPAMEILLNLKSNDTSPYVFPGKGSTGHLREPKQAWRRIKENAKVKDIRIHDLRRTLGSWLASQGESLIMIGKALNHSNTSTTAIYARLNIDPLRQAMEKNASRMLEFALPEKD